ncbi:MAG: vacuolar-type H+-ATPase subunit H [Candidatus Poriferisodalaceae bacterium]|jgi:vacuolar-type H+-ATPase subunit H
MSTPEPLSRPGVEALVRRVMDVVNAARPMPLSTSIMVNRDEILELLEHALDELPEEVREARWLLKERDEVVKAAHDEAAKIMEQTTVRVAQMVQKTEVVREAEGRAKAIIDQAEAQARRRRHEVDDYCDQKLAQFDASLERIHQTVAGARGKLRVESPPPPPEPEPTAETESKFFNQDTSPNAEQPL